MTISAADESSPQTTAKANEAGIDIPSLLADKEDQESSLLSAIALSSQTSNAKLADTLEATTKLRHSFTGKKDNSKGCTSTVIICNKTATVLKFDKASNRSGYIHGPETKNMQVKNTTLVKNAPTDISPGANVYFLQVNPTKTPMGVPKYDGTAGMLSLRIVVYDAAKKTWVDSRQAVAFSWKTSRGRPKEEGKEHSHSRVPNFAQFENATRNTERFIRRSDTIYDGTKICCDLQIDGIDSVHPVYTFSFRQEQRGKRTNVPEAAPVPLGTRIKGWFGRGDGQEGEGQQPSANSTHQDIKSTLVL